MSDYEIAQRRRNFIVGIFVLLGLVALVWLIFKFGDLPIKVSEINSFEITVQFPTAKGIQTNAPVEFCGYQIGRVTSVMAPEVLKDLDTGMRYHQTKVILSIDKRYVNIPSNVDVKLMTRSLGSSYIELQVDPTKPLVPLEPNQPETKYLTSGMLLQGSTGMTSEFFPEESQKKLEDLIAGLSTFVANANDIIGNTSNKDNITKTLANLSDASGQAVVTLKEFQQLASDGKTTVKKVDAKLDEVVSALVATSEDFRKFATSAATTMENADERAQELVSALVDTSGEISQAASQMRVMIEKVNNGDGTAAKLLNDGRFYDNLLDSTEQLQALLQELKILIKQVHEDGLRSIL